MFYKINTMTAICLGQCRIIDDVTVAQLKNSGPDNESIHTGPGGD
jgi:hypothetical protein